MTPYYEEAEPSVRLYHGHVLDVLRALPADSVHTCVTSPPYWGLRDYGIEPVVWDDQGGCDHVWGEKTHYGGGGQPTDKVRWQHTGVGPSGHPKIMSAFCQSCNSWRGSLGLEPTVELYLSHLVQVFREVRRVLRGDGVCWVNMGDAYFSQPGNGRGGGSTLEGAKPHLSGSPRYCKDLKPKDLIGLPWRVAFALQADGWWLRSDVIEEVELYCPCGCGYVMEERIWRWSQDRELIWKKPNPMPESVTDRPTRSHEYVFLLTKSARYYWDAEAVREPATVGNHHRTVFDNGPKVTPPGTGPHNGIRHSPGPEAGRNLRSVWTIPTAPFPDAHFATFPADLVTPPIKSSTSERGCCATCGAPWLRVVEQIGEIKNRWSATNSLASEVGGTHRERTPQRLMNTAGWRPGCAHYPRVDEWREIPDQDEDESDEAYADRVLPIRLLRLEMLDIWAHEQTIPCVMLDPFVGSGTSLYVARQLGRASIGVDLKAEYLELTKKRLFQGVLALEDP